MPARSIPSATCLTLALVIALIMGLALPALASPPAAPPKWRPVAPSHPGPMRPEQPGPEHSQSPFFLVLGGEDQAGHLPLQSTHASVRIAGVVAQVTVEQVYRNAGDQTLEAIYVFPASTRAAVHGLTMTLGERVVRAVIQEREAARRQYQAALDQGRTASLLEQMRGNVFQMRVGNILPGDTIKVELAYSEILVPRDGVYELVYPTVVGPRYARPGEEEAWQANPYLPQGQEAAFTFGLDLELASPLPVTEVTCPSHDPKIQYEGQDRLRVSLPASAQAGNRDFVLRYRLGGEGVVSGLWLQPGPDGGYFLMVMQPPARVTPQETPPREYIFVVDVSGSMHGFPLDTAKQVMDRLLGGLRPEDSFNILTFAGGNALMAPRSLAATPENLAAARAMLARQTGGGGTELMPALQRALTLPREGAASRSLVIITDGYVSVERQALELVRSNLGQANLFAFGVGSSVNRLLIQGLARAGLGEPFVVLGPAQAATQAAAFARYVAAPVLTGIKVEAQGFAASGLEPAAVPDLFAARPVVVAGRYTGPAQGKLVVTGRTAQGGFRRELDLASATRVDQDQAGGARAVELFWARSRIDRLGDLDRAGRDQDTRQAITALGLAHGLMTAYTSFVAVDTQVRADGKQRISVRQPLPLPQGVTDLAVGRAYKAAPMARLAPPPPASGHMMSGAPNRAVAMEEAADHTPRPTAPAAPRLVLADAEAPAGYGLTRALAALSQRLDKLSRDIPSTATRQKTVTLELTLDATGKITACRVFAPDQPKSLGMVLEQGFTGLALPAPAQAGAVIKLTVEVI